MEYTYLSVDEQNTIRENTLKSIEADHLRATLRLMAATSDPTLDDKQRADIVKGTESELAQLESSHTEISKIEETPVTETEET